MADLDQVQCDHPQSSSVEVTGVTDKPRCRWFYGARGGWSLVPSPGETWGEWGEWRERLWCLLALKR